jgi:hypothetical protein
MAGIARSPAGAGRNYTVAQIEQLPKYFLLNVLPRGTPIASEPPLPAGSKVMKQTDGGLSVAPAMNVQL